MPSYVARRAQMILNEDGLAMSGARVLLLGVTYKPDVPDGRESPAIPLAHQLVQLGAVIEYDDPYVSDWNPGVPAQRVEDISDSVAGADLVILVQRHASYDIDHLASIAKRFFDTRGASTLDSVHRL